MKMNKRIKKTMKKFILVIVKLIITSGVIFLFTDIMMKYLFTFTY